MTVRGLFVRIPAAQADALEAACERLGMTKQALVRSVLDAGLGTAAAPEPDAVLSFEALVELLGVDDELVRGRVEAGEIPGRRFGAEWRFSRAAVLDWLAGTDARPRATTGFGAEPGA